MPHISLVTGWLLVSLAFVTSLTYFTTRLLDPFYPTFFSLIPGLLLALTAIFLIAAITFLLLHQFGLTSHFLLNLGPVIEIASTFLCVVCCLTFSLVYGSTFSKSSQISHINSTALIGCRFKRSLCDSFRVSLQNQLSGGLHSYVSRRTVQAGSAAAYGLFFWLLIHGAMIYAVFEAPAIVPVLADPEERVKSRTPMRVPMVDDDETLE
jgi:hypothetical protein